MFYCEVLCTSQRAGIYASAAAVACLTPASTRAFTRDKVLLWLSHAARRHQVRRELKRAVTILRVDSVVVDLREGSPGFGTWEATRLDDRSRRAVSLAEGLGHAFMALTEQATVLYLCSTPYAPGREHAAGASRRRAPEVRRLRQPHCLAAGLGTTVSVMKVGVSS